MSRIEQAWQNRGLLAVILWPVSVLYRLIVTLRRLTYKFGLAQTHRSRLPVVVVGNISVGGTGKSPLTAWLVQTLKASGWSPAIVSRGYGGERHLTPHLVNTETDTAALVGDEPLMLAKQTAVPVCVCVRRAKAVERIVNDTHADIIIADDGLQHLAMQRAYEIVVIDNERGLGNGWMLPAGPLRESRSRLRSVDLIVVNGWSDNSHASRDQQTAALITVPGMHDQENDYLPSIGGFRLAVDSVVDLASGEAIKLARFSAEPVHAVAGIGHPERFFITLRNAGIEVMAHPFDDHHKFSTEDIQFDDTKAVLVTSKDAVKLRSLVKLPRRVFEVRVRVVADTALTDAITVLENKLRGLA
ncbi:MAG: tetraacyldisaccharide 4'-kinase [Granulosicoccus sp.]